MTEKDFDLGRGITLHTVQTEKFKISRLSLSFVMTSDRVRSPLIKLALSTLMRGSCGYPSLSDINKRLDYLYGSTVSFRAASDGDRTVFKISCDLLDDRYIPDDERLDTLKETLAVVEDILFRPLRGDDGLLCENYIESEKSIACDSLRAKINDQKAYSAERCREIMFEGEPCGIPVDGKVELIESFTSKEISDSLDSLLSESAVECYYVGTKDGEIIASMLTDFFANVKCREPAVKRYGYSAFVSDRAVRSVTESMPISQSRLNIGLRCGVTLADKEYYAMSLFNELFGASSTSKLFMNVREKKSLCYYCSSVYMVSKGIIFIGCGIKDENKDKAYREIMKQLSNMAKGKFSDEEIEVAKKTLCSSYRQISDSPSYMENYKFRRLMAGISDSPLDGIAKVNAVTRDEIVEAAKKVVVDTVYYLRACADSEVEI